MKKIIPFGVSSRPSPRTLDNLLQQDYRGDLFPQVSESWGSVLVEQAEGAPPTKDLRDLRRLFRWQQPANTYHPKSVSHLYQNPENITAVQVNETLTTASFDPITTRADPLFLELRITTSSTLPNTENISFSLSGL